MNERWESSIRGSHWSPNASISRSPWLVAEQVKCCLWFITGQQTAAYAGGGTSTVEYASIQGKKRSDRDRYWGLYMES